MNINAREFIQIWQKFSEDIAKQEELNVKIHEWREVIVGNVALNDYPLADYIRKNFQRLSRHVSGYNGVALSMTAQGNFSKINTLGSEQKHQKEAFTPVGLDILLEHEEELDKSFEQMQKLVNRKAKLKVLITYHLPSTEDLKARIAENFQKIIQQANDVFPENPATEYLLIIGQPEGEKMLWFFYVYQLQSSVFYTKYQPIA